jgi:hypothetical protein
VAGMTQSLAETTGYGEHITQIIDGYRDDPTDQNYSKKTHDRPQVRHFFSTMRDWLSEKIFHNICTQYKPERTDTGFTIEIVERMIGI